MLTFSTPPTEASLLPGLVNVLSVLPDNTAKEISPKDVRDAVYTLWHNTILKPTSVSGSSVKYLGTDQYELRDSPSGELIYPKMYFGKKQVGGQFVMNDLLLGTDTDFFFYNTKNNQSVGNFNTTLAILAGTGTYLINGQLAAPSLKSTVVSDSFGSYINFDIRNSSFYVDGTGTQSGGDINITSDKGYVTINNFSFPKFADHYGSSGAAKNDYVLKYKWAGTRAIGVWESAFSQSVTSINSTGQVSISGSPVVINGFNFTDATIVATAIGGINAGETFSNVSVMDMFRRIIYTYIPPIIETGFRTSLDGPNVSIIERGDPAYASSGNLKLYYKLTVNSTASVTSIGFSEAYAALPNPLLGGGAQSNQAFPPLIGGGIPRRGTPYYNAVTSQIPLAPNDGSSYKYITNTFSVTDTKGSTVKATAQMVAVLPYFYGTHDQKFTDGSAISNILDTDENFTLRRLSLRLVNPIIGTPTVSNNQSVILTTNGLNNNQGFIYFGYPSQFPQLIDIRDNQGANGNSVLDRFSTYSVTISSQNSPSRWGSQPYLFYILKETTTVPLSGVPFRFLFAPQT